MNRRKGYKQTEEHIRRRNESRRIKNPNWWMNKEEVAKKNAEKQKQYWAEGRYNLNKQGVEGRQLFKLNNPMKNPDIVAKAIFNHFRGEPSKYELILIEIIKENRFPYVYTGNGKLIIEGKCPDFKHISENKLIELHIDKRQGLIKEKLYTMAGYKILWLLNNELKNRESVIEKIKNF